MAEVVLLPDRHERIIANQDKIARRAGITLPHLHYNMTYHGCSEQEREFVKQVLRLRSKMRYPGLLYTGEEEHMDSRMRAMAGAFIRKYVDARVVSVWNLIKDLEAREGEYNATVLLIPNLYTVLHGKQYTGYHVSKLHDFLMDRVIHAKVTAVYVEDLARLGKEYGRALPELFREHYLTLDELT